MEFSWPPKDEDLEGCAIVALEGEDVGRITPLVLGSPDLDVEAADAPPLPVPPTVEPPPLPLPPAVAVDDASAMREWKYFGRAAFWRVERSDALARFMLEHESRRDDPEAAVAARSAWLALFVAASCLLVTYSEFRADGLRGPSASEMLTTAFASDTDPVPSPDAVPGAAPKFRPPVVQAPAPQRPAARPSAPAPAPAPIRPRASAPIVRPPAPRPEPPRYVPAVATMRVLPTPPPAAVVPPPPPVSAVVARATTPSPASPAPTPVGPAIATAANRVMPEPIATRIDTVALNNEEDDIRSTLTRFRTAYSQLNATAAQEVWPSVDVRALRSAFRGLKSQELHFDRCQLTVAGARARAACTGRAVYVPGVGDQSPRTSPRAWNFELTKARERWTIASARSS